MDHYYEQLIKMHRTGRDWFVLGTIWISAFVLVYLTVLASFRFSSLIGFFILIVFAIAYGAFYLSKRLSIEYEFIVVNKDLDIDKIIAQSSRKRVLSLKLTAVEEFGVYNQKARAKFTSRNFDGKIVAANPGDTAYYMVARHAKKGVFLVVVCADVRLKEELLRSVPKTALEVQE